MQNSRKKLVTLIKEHCYTEGEVILTHGKKSSYYIDLRKLTLSPHIRLIAQEICGELSDGDIAYHAIGGPETGANQIIGAYLAVVSQCRGFVVRKQPKDHGIDPMELVVGSVQKGDLCVLVEDVITTGTSLLNAAMVIERYGCEVVHAIAVVDRLEGGERLLADYRIPLTSLLTIRDLEKF